MVQLDWKCAIFYHLFLLSLYFVPFFTLKYERLQPLWSFIQNESRKKRIRRRKCWEWRTRSVLDSRISIGLEIHRPRNFVALQFRTVIIVAAVQRQFPPFTRISESAGVTWLCKGQETGRIRWLGLLHSRHVKDNWWEHGPSFRSDGPRSSGQTLTTDRCHRVPFYSCVAFTPFAFFLVFVLSDGDERFRSSFIFANYARNFMFPAWETIFFIEKSLYFFL